MNTPPNRPGAPAPESASDDPSIPVLTERLGLPPLEFDTTLPLIESTGQMLEPVLEGLTSLPSPPPAPLPPRSTPAPAPASTPAPAAAAAPATARSSPPSVVAAAPLPGAALSGDARMADAGAALGALAGGGSGARVPVDGGHWGRIEIELRSSILRAVGEQLPQEIESIVRAQLSGPLEDFIGKLAAETRIAITTTLRTTVERAVRAELERLRASGRGTA
jgi:hypothetical protein